MSGSPKGGGAGPPGDSRGGGLGQPVPGNRATHPVSAAQVTLDPAGLTGREECALLDKRCPLSPERPWSPTVRAGDRTSQAAARGGRRHVGPEAWGSAGPLTRLCVPLCSWDASGKVLPETSSVRSLREAASGPTLTLTLTLTMG